MKIRFGLDIDIDMEDVEVEGNSIEDCKNKLFQMSVQEMLEAGGYVKNYTIDDVDYEILESTLQVECKNIEYDLDEDELDFEEVKNLPTELTVTVTVEDRDDIEDAVKEAFTRPILTTEQAKEWNPALENQVAK